MNVKHCVLEGQDEFIGTRLAQEETATNGLERAVSQV